MDRMSVKKPTMRDIAREVGTSAVTVSKAMAGKTGMSDELRMKILKKASEMGYEYPHSSRLLSREHLEVGILIPDKYFEPDSFYAEIYKRLVKKLADLGHFGLLELLDPENEQNLVLPTLLTTKHVDGLIMLGESAKAYYRKVAQAGASEAFRHGQVAEAESAVLPPDAAGGHGNGVLVNEDVPAGSVEVVGAAAEDGFADGKKGGKVFARGEPLALDHDEAPFVGEMTRKGYSEHPWAG